MMVGTWFQLARIGAYMHWPTQADQWLVWNYDKYHIDRLEIVDYTKKYSIERSAQEKKPNKTK